MVIYDNQLDNIKKFKELITNLYNGSGSDLDSRFIARINAMKPEGLDRLWTWFPDDTLVVSYKLEGQNRFEPIKQASPGQKTAALLSFLLSYGNDPLIIDQPEDDLDNRLIYNLIVKNMREKKQERQIIVITHNANIVVNGDSENIIILDIVHGQTKITKQESLQDKSIRGDICRIMEGGEEAFEQRYRRIKCH